LRLRWWRVFDYILVYTDEEARFLSKSGFGNKTVVGINNGLDQTKIEAVKSYWGPDQLPEWQQQQGITEQTILLSSARLESKNRFDLVIQALPGLIQQFPNLLWCVIGDGRLRYNLEELAAEMGVNDHIRWLGAMYDEEMVAPWFLSSQLLIHPGAIGLTLLHAFGYGLPVVTHNNLKNQMPEIVAFEEGINGLLFEEANVDSLCQQIERLLTDESARQQFGENALQVARTSYNSQVMTERFVQIVKACHSNRG
jgi:glycosyltransferase involved in cell wall biosynthesis